MNCEATRPLLSVYLDGELDAKSHASVAAHLAECQACARRLQDYRVLGQQIRALPDAPLPAGMVVVPAARRWPRLSDGRGLPLLVRGLSTLLLILALAALTVGTARVVQRMQALSQPAEIVATYPPNGASDVALDARLTLVFARPMNETSVEAAIYISPTMLLAFAWQDQTLTVVPFADWQPATTYTLTVASTARELEGGALQAPFALRFETTGALPGSALHPIGRFGYLWRAALGGPGGPLGYATAEEQELWSAVQPLERGLLVWLDQLYEDQVYVLTYGQDEQHGDWQQYADTWREGDLESAGLTPPEGLLEPIRGFGRVWREELGGPGAAVGWALAAEQGYVGAVQPFEHGLMLWNPLNGTVYLLWDDATWVAYPPSS